MSYSEIDDVLPGDTITFTSPLTIVSVGWGGNYETEEGVTIDSGMADFEINKERPENWPPRDDDVWRVDHSHLHCLGDELFDSDGVDIDLADWLENNGYKVTDLRLVFRPGVKEAK